MLLSGTDKSTLGVSAPGRHIDPSVDLDCLAVCFGGFSPTAMGADAARLREAVELVERRLSERRAAKEEEAAIRAAHASQERAWTDGAGVSWRYVVLDDAKVRIEGCSLSGCDECTQATLDIPGSIEGKPVVALAADSCCDLRAIERIIIPDAIVMIGSSAFRNCRFLREVSFPADLATFDPGWLRNCPRLERVKLPGRLDKITPSLFDLASLRVLSIGRHLAEVMPGAFAKSQLTAIEIDDANEFLSTDGAAIYSEDGSVLVAMAVPKPSYQVARGCVAIGNKGLSAFEDMVVVTLPEGVELIGDFAFTRTGIEKFEAPSTLKAIGERAFFACARLAQVTLNQGLERIGGNAFTDTAIHELCIPSTIESLGNPIAAGTRLTYSGSAASFRIASHDDATEGVPAASIGHLSLDEQGALYRLAEDGLHLVRMLEPAAVEYVVRPNTVAIDEGAFAKHAAIERVVLNDGLKAIGKGAFRDARKLVEASLPDTLESLGDEAFLGTNIERMRIPARLTRIGSIALVTEGAHHGTKEPSLRHLEVDPANPRFSLQSGLLVERMDNGVKRVVLCTGEVPDVVVPRDVTAIASYAFNGVRRLHTLAISEDVTAVDVRGLAFDCWLELIRIDVARPIEGHDFFEFKFPNTPRATQQMRHAFGSPNFVSAEVVFKHYDTAIANRSGFDAAEEESRLSAYDQGRLIVDRLRDPVCMTSTNRGMMESALRGHLIEICVDVARHDDKDVIDGLLDLGYISDENINDVISAVGVVQDASITNHLLDQKRRRFGGATIDFDL